MPISRRVFVFTALSLILLVSLLLFAAQQIASARISHTYMTNTEDQQNAMAEGIKLFVADIGMFSFRVQNDNPLFESLTDAELSYGERAAAYRARLEELADWSVVADIVVVDDGGDTYTSGKTAFRGQPDLYTVEQIAGSAQGIWINGVERDAAGTAYIRLGYPYHHTVYGWNGAIFIYVPETALYDAYEDAGGQTGRSLVVTGDGLILAGRDKDKVGTTLFDAQILTETAFHYLRLPYEGEDSRQCAALRSADADHPAALHALQQPEPDERHCALPGGGRDSAGPRPVLSRIPPGGRPGAPSAGKARCLRQRPQAGARLCQGQRR